MLEKKKKKKKKRFLTAQQYSHMHTRVLRVKIYTAARACFSVHSGIQYASITAVDLIKRKKLDFRNSYG